MGLGQGCLLGVVGTGVTLEGCLLGQASWVGQGSQSLQGGWKVSELVPQSVQPVRLKRATKNGAEKQLHLQRKLLLSLSLWHIS